MGVDLAWGETKHDGLCFLEWDGKRAIVAGFAYPHGDKELSELIRHRSRGWSSVAVTVDAPIVCPNRTGTRPVDRLTHTMFHREHAACHPANSTKCPRPVRIGRILAKAGYKIGWQTRGRTVSEVYPHPAMVRLFGISRIVKYKKGPVSAKRREFGRLQRLMRRCLVEKFSLLSLNQETEQLLRTRWSKETEDRTDALFCALIGFWHRLYGGRRSEVIGDRRTGFILLPQG